MRELLDLVIDDASHLLEETRRAFDTLFARLRSGGLYIIEDWSWAHVPSSFFWPDRTPLTVLIFETVLACASVPGLIDEIAIDRAFACVRRGDAPIQEAGFDLSRCYDDRGSRLLGRS
jgi:hypothetical protein